MEDAFPQYRSTSSARQDSSAADQRRADFTEPGSSLGGWSSTVQRQGVMTDVGMLPTSILPDGGLGATHRGRGVQLPYTSLPSSRSGSGTGLVHSNQLQQQNQRYSFDGLATALPPLTSSSTGVTFQPLRGTQQSSGHHHFPLVPLSARSRSASRSIPSPSSFSDSPRSQQLSPPSTNVAPTSTTFAAGIPFSTNSGSGGLSDESGGTPKSTAKAEKGDLPLGVPPGLGK